MTFGATDAPLKAKDLEAAGLEQWPMVMGGIVPVVNLDGVKSGDLVIDGPTLAKIYLGDDHQVERSGDQGAQPEGRPSRSRHRRHSPRRRLGNDFQLHQLPRQGFAGVEVKVGEATSVEWPVGIGAKGNDGVANNVAGTKGAIGYVEYAYAKQNKLTYADMVNKAGKTVEPTIEAFQAAAANADWANAPGFYLILSNQPGDESWPMTAATFILMYKKPVDVDASNEALKFFTYGYDKGAEQAKALDYIPMPDKVVAMVKKAWAADIHRNRALAPEGRRRSAVPLRYRRTTDPFVQTSERIRR